MTDGTHEDEQNRVAADCPNERLVMRDLEIKILVPPVITGEGVIITGCTFELVPCTYQLTAQW